MLLLLLPLSPLLHENVIEIMFGRVYGELAIQEHDQDEIIGKLYIVYNIFFFLIIFIYHSLVYIYIFHSNDIYLFNISSRHIIYLFIISCDRNYLFIILSLDFHSIQ